MKKVLLIDESPLFRDYLTKRLKSYGFDVSTAMSGLDGAGKLRSVAPDLLITDYHLTRKPLLELLREKHDNTNIRDIPVIIVSPKVDRKALVEVAPYNVTRFLTKPIRIDALLNAVSEALDVSVSIDTTPCIVEAHVNEDILFIEIAQGLSLEKIDLLRYKIGELLDLYDLKSPKVMILMTSIEVSTVDSIKLSALFTSIIEATGAMKRYTKVLTRSDYIKTFLEKRSDFSGIEVTDSLERAMDGLMEKPVGGPILQTPDVREDVVGRSAPKKRKSETIDMRFHMERPTGFNLSELGDSVQIAIVDDDQVIQELIRASFSDTKVRIKTYGNGRVFIDDPEAMKSDLVFLDLMMPEMDGFKVLEKINQKGIKIPIIVLSALSKRDTVVEVLKMGVSSYIIKPLRPQDIRIKASEILQLNF